MIKERRLMLQQPVMAGIEPMNLSERKVPAEQVRDRRVIKPMPMQPPFRTRVDQPVKRQRQQHLIPTRALTTRRQTLAPEVIQPELPPQLAAQPAGAPLTRTAQRHLRELDAHDRQIIRPQRIRRMLIGKERHLLRRIIILAEEIDRLAPGRLLDAIDLAEIKHMPLNDTLVREPTIFDHTPVAVLLAILDAF